MGGLPRLPQVLANEGLVLRRGSGRPTKATERVLLFAKGPGYFFDQEAVREAQSESTPGASADGGAPAWTAQALARRGGAGDAGFKARLRGATSPAGRNLRDWWVIGPEPLKDAHYAASPLRPARALHQGGDERVGLLPGCGAPWARVLETARRYVPARAVRAPAPGGLRPMARSATPTTPSGRPTTRPPSGSR